MSTVRAEFKTKAVCFNGRIPRWRNTDLISLASNTTGFVLGCPINLKNLLIWTMIFKRLGWAVIQHQ